jgi:hypothetical protein
MERKNITGNETHQGQKGIMSQSLEKRYETQTEGQIMRYSQTCNTNVYPI